MKEEKRFLHYKNKRRIITGVSFVILLALYILKSTSLVLRATSTIGLLFVFYLIDHLFDLRFKHYHYLFITIIAITSWMLSNLYYLYPNYDKIQHLVLPILFASIVYHMTRRFKLEPKWRLVFVFFVVLGVIGLHEIGEYLLDNLLGWQTQGVFLRDFTGLEKYYQIVSRIDDTMIDMSFGIIGAAIYVISNYFGRRFGKKKH